jgi:succinoglycan biosynthesis protein ExoM
MTEPHIKPENHVTVGVCTFRRASLTDTLRSIAAQALPAGYGVTVVVADNDDAPSSEAMAREAAARLGLDLVYRHAPARNISIARNACLAAADGAWLAFLDDDEIAEPGWLAALLAAAGRTGAAATLGPVDAVYPEDAPEWMTRGDFHATRPVYVEGRIVTGYTCNVLIRRDDPAVAGERFDPAFGASGGEDTDYFARITGKGGTIAFAEDARVVEPVLASRARFSWLLKRRFRSGQTHGVLLARSGGLSGRTKALGLALAKAAASFAGAGASALDPTRRRFWILRGALHAGVASRLLGLRERRLYGQPEGPAHA